jgi:hypothetical protein
MKRNCQDVTNVTKWALAQSCPGERSESGVAVQIVSKPVICHGVGIWLRADARFAHRSAAKLGVWVQDSAGFVLGAECSKNHDEPINYTVRVIGWFYFIFL